MGHRRRLDPGEDVPMIVSPAAVPVSGRNTQPVWPMILPTRRERVSGVRIRPSPPHSLYCFNTIWRWRRMRACRGLFAFDANRRDAPCGSFGRFGRESLHAKKIRFASGFERFPAAFAHLSAADLRGASAAGQNTWLLRPQQRQVDPIQQSLSTQFSRLVSLADRFNDCGCCESQARETLDVAPGDVLATRNVGERPHLA